MANTAPRPRRRLEPLDPIYYSAFPVFYSAMAIYGYLAAFDLLPSIEQSTGISFARGFGIAIGIVCTTAAVAALHSLRSERPFLELCATAGLIGLMVVYAASIFGLYFSGMSGTTSPRAAFIPILFIIFPIYRVFAIGRSGRLPTGRS